MSLKRGNKSGGIGGRIKPYLSIFLYVILLNASIVAATVVIHESGHYALGHVFDCKNMKIVLFDGGNGGTYTQMNCSPGVDVKILALGGFLFIIPFALFFFLIRGPERHFWLVIIGFNLMIAYSDIEIITNLFMMPAILAFSGVGMLILGETLLIDRYIYGTIKIKEMEDII